MIPLNTPPKKKFRLLSCEIFYRELCHAVSRCIHRIDLEFLTKGLHDIGSKEMCQRLQSAIDSIPVEGYDAVLLGYGLCNNGLVGLEAREIPLVVPRAHDCITLFLGSTNRYLEYFNSHPGVYFKTTGWIERGSNTGQLGGQTIQHLTGMDLSYQQLVDKYGEENAQFLYQELRGNEKGYHQFTFIEMGVEPDDRFEKQVATEASERGWKFEKIQGDLSLLQKLVDGDWSDPEFLVVPPYHRVVAHYGEGLILAEPIRRIASDA